MYKRQSELMSSLLLEKKDSAALRSETERLSNLTQQLRSDLKDQSRGVDNLIWQLDQKETQVRALEQRLRDTFPIQPPVTAPLPKAVSSSSVPQPLNSSSSSSCNSSGESCDDVRVKKKSSSLSPAAKAQGGSGGSRSKRRRTAETSK